MHPCIAPLLAQLGAPGRALAAPGVLIPPATLARGQVAAFSTALGADGATWQQVAGNVPRFVGTARRLLHEGQRTNTHRNPRAEGLVPGTPGTPPTFWQIDGGTTREILGGGVEFGLPYLDVRLSGNGGGQFEWQFDTSLAVATLGQTWTASVFLRRLAGAISGGSPVLRIYEFNAVVAQDASITPLDGTLRRYVNTYTTTQPGTVGVQARITFPFPAAGPWTFTLRIYAPQLELGAFASTPILPPVGAPAAATRGTDVIPAPLSGLGIGGNGAGTYLWSGVLANPSTSDVQVIAHIDDGGFDNRFLLWSDGATSVALSRSAAGAFSTVYPAAFVPGVPFRAGLSIDGAGRAAVSVNGGPVLAVTGGPTAGMTTLRLGTTPGGFAAMFGEIGAVRVIPRAVSDAALQSLVAGLPT